MKRLLPLVLLAALAPAAFAAEEQTPCQKVTSTLVGQALSSAMERIADAGLYGRVASAQGKDFVMTMDYREDRVNLSIIDDHVVKATCG